MPEDQTRELLTPPSDDTTTSMAPTSTTTVTTKRETFDPYRFGKIQFSTQFFKRLVQTPLPEVPQEDLVGAEDAARPLLQAQPSSLPEQRKLVPLLLFIGGGVATIAALAFFLTPTATVAEEPPKAVSPTPTTVHEVPVTPPAEIAPPSTAVPSLPSVPSPAVKAPSSAKPQAAEAPKQPRSPASSEPTGKPKAWFDIK